MKNLRDPSWRAGPIALALAICLWAWSGPAALAGDPISQVGQWSDLFPLGNVAVHTHVLPTGQVMFWPRHESCETRNPDPQRTLPRLWDPATKKVTILPLFPPPPANPVLNVNLFCSGHAFLPDGRLFVAGGHDVFDSHGLKTAFIYDPIANTWLRLADMKNGRWYPTVVALPSGEMLVLSGQIDLQSDMPPDDNHGMNGLPQVWSPSGGPIATDKGVWRDLTTAQDKKFELYPFLHIAPKGQVFMSGILSNTRLLNTTGTGGWTPVADHIFLPERDYGSSVMYADGKVMVMGGGTPAQKSAELIDLNDSAPTWTAAHDMNFARRQMNAAILPDGKILVSGGSSGSNFSDGKTAILDIESWDPDVQGKNVMLPWTQLAPQAEARLYHSTLVLLPSGQILSAGGGQPAFLPGDNGNHTAGGVQPTSPPGDPDDVNDHYTGQLYSPPYLCQGGARPSITTAPTDVTYGSSFAVTTPDAASIAKVRWIRLPSVTHSFNQNQRINVLGFAKDSAGLALNVQAPSDRNLCPPGHYMLFILDGRGVPSVASIIRIH